MASPDLPPPTPAPKATPSGFEESTHVVAPSSRPPGRWRWLAPLMLTAAGIAGVAVFGVLSIQKSRQNVAAAEGELAEAEDKLAESSDLRTQRDEARAEAEAQRFRAEQAEGELARIEQAETAAAEKAKAAEEAFVELTKRVRELTGKDYGQVRREGQELSIRLSEKMLFENGEAGLTKRGKRYLRRLGAALRKAEGRPIWIQGYSAGAPAKGKGKGKGKAKPTPSEVELDAARAQAVAEFLEQAAKIEGRRLAALVYSKYRPGKRRGRGLELRLMAPSE